MTATRPLRVAHVSDTHFAPDLASANTNWAAIVDHLRNDPPDLVVHTGDVTLDGALDDDQFDHARARMDELPCPWLAIPGNHDIGDIAPTPVPVTVARRDAYESRFGPGCWTHEQGGWRILGVDVQSLVADGDDGAGGDGGDGGDGQSDRWKWLEAALSQPGPTMLCLHRPLWPPDGEDDVEFRYVPEPDRSRLAALVAAADVRLIASGHVHQHARIRRDGLVAEWAPSTWAVVPDSVQPVIADKRVGYVHHELGDGVASRLVVPSSMEQFTIGVEFPSPYDNV